MRPLKCNPKVHLFYIILSYLLLPTSGGTAFVSHTPEHKLRPGSHAVFSQQGQAQCAFPHPQLGKLMGMETFSGFKFPKWKEIKRKKNPHTCVHQLVISMVEETSVCPAVLL